MTQVSIEKVDANTLKVTYNDPGDSVTLHLEGDMLAIDFDKSGAMTVRRADTRNTVLLFQGIEDYLRCLECPPSGPTGRIELIA